MSRMIFPFEEPEPAYQWGGNLDFAPDYMGALEYWAASKYFPPEEPTYVPYVISAGGGAASKLVEPSRVVHRASPGLRKPRLVDGVAFGWDRGRGMYSEQTSVDPQSFDSWWKSFEESQFSWLGRF